jgi:hypothetical protein
METTTMTAMGLATTILGAMYLLAIVERLTRPEIIEDGESMGYDNEAEQEWENTRDYYLAASHDYYDDF